MSKVIMKIGGNSGLASFSFEDDGSGNPVQKFGGTQTSKISDPTGGATTDAEARTAINAIIDALEAAGITASS